MPIVEALAAEQVAQIRELLAEYWESCGFTPCFQNFDAELAALPGEYASPAGRLALALSEGQPVGCVALRRLDRSRGEMKRLYVRVAFRGCGWGRQLLDWAIAEARAAGYRELLCDTMPAMADALAMYRRTGFEFIAPYTGHPTEGAIFLRLEL